MIFSMPGLLMKHAWYCLAILQPREMTVLRAFYKQALTMPKPPALMKASMKLPEQSLGREVPDRELDAFTAVGSVLFNLDAALVR